VTKQPSRRSRGRPAIEPEKVALRQETYEIEINAVDGMVCWDRLMEGLLASQEKLVLASFFKMND
jgi:hypothetical protein